MSPCTLLQLNYGPAMGALAQVVLQHFIKLKMFICIFIDASKVIYRFVTLSVWFYDSFCACVRLVLKFDDFFA